MLQHIGVDHIVAIAVDTESQKKQQQCISNHDQMQTFSSYSLVPDPM